MKTPTATTTTTLDQIPPEAEPTSNSNTVESSEASETVDAVSTSNENPFYKAEKEIEDDASSYCGSCCMGGGSRVHEQFANSTNSSTKTESSTGSSDSANSDKLKRNPLVRFIRRIKNSNYTKPSYYRNNISFYVTVFGYFIVQIVLVLIQMHIYSDVNWAVKMARAGGILLNFNSGLIVLLVLRRLVTWVRNSVIGRNYLPVDHFIKFHKYIGMLILLYSIIHTVGHCINLCKLLIASKFKLLNEIEPILFLKIG
jgi:hypothetical protein